MKKLFILLLCLAFFTGCSSQDKKEETQKNQPSTSDVNENQNQSTDDWYTQFEKSLEDNKIQYSSKNMLDAKSVGGVEGYRYVTDNGNIDIYRYEDGDDFERILKEKTIGEDQQKVEINDHMVIVSEGVSQDILDVFKNLK